MHTVVAEPAVCALSSRPTPDSDTHNYYEACCGLCGAQIHFRNPLTDWTKVYCPGCGEYIAVR
jgi:predicted RNA-binding Zn-ribbon protein involved in translation (DUF1610 family)